MFGHNRTVVLQTYCGKYISENNVQEYDGRKSKQEINPGIIYSQVAL